MTEKKPKIFNEPRMRAMMERDGIDLVVLSNFANSAYASGFLNNGGHLSYRPFVVFYFLDEARKPAFIVPAVDLHLAMHFTWIEDVRAYAMAEFFTDLDVHFYDDFLSAARDVLAERNVTNLVVGTEGDNLPKAIRGGLDALLSGNEVVDVGSKMDLVRMVKTPVEVSRLRKATDITIKAHESFRAAIKPGNTDRDLFTAANVRMFEEGADGIEFINVGTGPVSYAAHCPFPVGHVLEEGDFVKVDMGAQCQGYGADFVRSYFIGRATNRHKTIWQHLNDVQVELGLWLRPGVTGGEIFERGYREISRHLDKFPREFIGHGIGLVAHEQPRMNRPNRTVLEPDTVVCIEFSYYHDGVRFHTEDTFLVKDDGVEFWTESCPRELVVPV